MPNKEQELWCLDQLRSAISKRYPGTVTRCKKGDEPPDFWLNIDKRRFAVEISTIREEDENTNWRSLCDLVQQIESKTTKAEELQGRYLFLACGIPGRGRRRRRIEEAIRAYLRETQSDNSSDARDLVIDGERLGSIEKYAGNGSALYVAGNTTNTGCDEQEVACELRALVNESIRKKRVKLRDVGHPAVLVLYDLYGLEGNPDRFAQYVMKAPDVSFFHTVFVIYSYNGDGVFAYESGSLKLISPLQG